MGLAPGGRMKQEIYEDPYDFADWDLSQSSRCFVHIANSRDWRMITRQSPPTQPPTAADYTRYGLPWFDYYDDSPAVEGSGILGKLKSVLGFAKEKRLVKGRIVSGYDYDFPSKEIETALPFESFPTGELVAVAADGGRALRLSEFFSVEQVERRIIDVGVLDRREKDTGKLVYTLTRERAAP